jgi:hypothetical protein
MGMFGGAACAGFDKIMDAAFALPILIRVYIRVFLGFSAAFLFYLFLPFAPPIHFVILLGTFPLWSIIPQFFITRWLAKTAESFVATDATDK